MGTLGMIVSQAVLEFIVENTSVSSSASVACSITIAPAGGGGGVGPPSVICGNPPEGTVGVLYQHLVPAFGGTPPYTFAISAGALPGGLTMLPATGFIQGFPLLAGVYPFTVQVTDSANLTGSVNCSITVLDRQVMPAGGIKITLRGVKLRPACEPKPLQEVPKLPSVKRAM